MIAISFHIIQEFLLSNFSQLVSLTDCSCPTQSYLYPSLRMILPSKEEHDYNM